MPATILSDNAQQFVSKSLNELCVKYGIKHIFCPKYSPQSNVVERTNRSILSAVRSYIHKEHKTWDEHIHQVASALRDAIHETTGYSPHYIVFGQHKISNGAQYDLLDKLKMISDNNIDPSSPSERLSLI